MLRFRKYLGYISDPKTVTYHLYGMNTTCHWGVRKKMGGIRETSLIFISCSCMTDVLGMNGRENV